MRAVFAFDHGVLSPFLQAKRGLCGNRPMTGAAVRGDIAGDWSATLMLTCQR